MKKYLFIYFSPILINILISITDISQLNVNWKLLSIFVTLFLNIIIIPLFMMGWTHVLILASRLYISLFLCFISVTFSPIIYVFFAIIAHGYEYTLRYYIHDIVANLILRYQVIIPGIMALTFCLIEILMIIKRKRDSAIKQWWVQL